MNNTTDTVDGKVARPYQLRLFDHAVKHNSIIYLPTGSGKTYIAIMIIRHFSKHYMLPIEEGGKRCAVLCNTVALARQLVNEIAAATNFQVGLFIGDMNVDNWPQEKWKSEINSNQIIVGTSQVFVDMASHNYLSIQNLSCVIIDECHHATKSHPMHQFLSLFMYSPQKDLPRAVGLTGILLKSGKKNDILKPLDDLEAVFRGKIITVENLNELHNVLIYSTCPKENVLQYVNVMPVFDVEQVIVGIINNCMTEIQVWNIGEIKTKYSKNLRNLQEPNKIKQANSLLSDFIYQMDDMGIYPASIAIMGLIVQFEVNKRNAETLLLKDMYRYLLTRCELIRHIIVKKLKTYCDDNDDDDIDEADVIINFSKPKLQSLFSYFIKEFSNKKASDINCLLFVQRRYTAKCLCFVIKKFAATYKGLSHIAADFMIGRNAGIIYSIDSILDSKWNRLAIERFRTKECNLIVCSSVLEEGIDVQACNYVIAFDPIKQFGSYVQMKGRARSVESTFLVVCEAKEVVKVTQQIKHYKEIDRSLKDYLLTRTIDREVPDHSPTQQQLVKPFITSTGAILQAESAIILINRYCQTLPHDSFTNLTPIWNIISDELNNFQLSMELPLQSTVKEIIYSDVVRTCKDAKISCAFKGCLKLYENGELNENLLPVTKKLIIENVSDIYFNKWKDQANVECPNEGTKKNQQIYDIFWPKETSPNMPLPDQRSYVYRIKTIPNFTKTDTNVEIFEMLSSQSSYAIVCSNKLPAFAPMPLFVTQGQLTVEICNTPLEVTIRDGGEMNLLKKFTKMIFHDIRKFWQDFLALSNGDKPNSFLIVPTTHSGVIDWDLIRKFQRLSPVREPSEVERTHKIYRPEDYIGKVVCTWYNDCDDGPRYTVTKIFKDLTPLSPFPEENGTVRNQPYTFADYVETKYGRRVMQRNQFMIEARPINKRSRFFVNITEKNDKTKNKKRINKIILIPEMCHNFNFPGDLWLKALLLPSILHRLHYLQCAEWLRIDINKFLGIPSPSNYSPAPLQIDYSLARVQSEDENESPRSLLPALEKMQIDDFTKTSHALIDVEQGNWKTYHEPIDVFRNVNSVYPIEIDYYYLFVNHLLHDMDNLSLENVTEQQVSTCNLKPYQPKIDHKDKQHMKKIKYSTEDFGYRLELLEKTRAALTTAEQYEFLAAITTAAANDVFDMERFEVLGDSFLKFSVSLLLMNRHPTWNEGLLTATKSKMVSNRNFLYCMRSKYNTSFIRTSNFDARDEWLPPMSAIPANVLDAIEQKQIPANSLSKLHLTDNEKESGSCSQSTLMELFENLTISDVTDDAINVFFFKQTVRDKVMADCLEALLGVCVKNYGVEKCFKMLDYFGIFNDKNEDTLSNLLKIRMVNPLVKPNVRQSDIDSYLPNYHYLEESLKYKFQDRAYLLQALTHPSYPTNRLTGCYQQLEFIGDAILDFLISSYIYESCTKMTPGEITDLRSALVNNITLACICVRNRFHQFMLFESPALSDSIKKFVEFQNVQDHRVTDQVRILLEEISSPESFNMAQNVDVPKALGDIFEAIIGAIFIDSGNDLKQTWDVIYHLMRLEINDFSERVPIDPVRELYENRGANPSFTLYRVEPDVVMIQCAFHCRHLVKTVIGCGGNQVMAKKAAAKMALQVLQRN